MLKYVLGGHKGARIKTDKNKINVFMIKYMEKWERLVREKRVK